MDAARQRALTALGIRRWLRRMPAHDGADGELAQQLATEEEAQQARPLRDSPASVAGGVEQASPRAPREAPVGAAHGAVAASGAPAVVDYEPPRDWAGLRAAVSVCQRCRLCETRHQTVFGVGPERASLMVVGEGPGAEEDAQGEPFVGRAGKLLDQMLKAIGYARDTNVFITNVVKCRPPGNRDPLPDEVTACRPYLDRQIELVAPRLIVGLGRVAAQRLLDTNLPLARLRGAVHHYGARQTPVMLTYHPAYLLRSPREKAKTWQDLKAVARFLALPPEP